MRSIFLLLSFTAILYANTKLIPTGSPIPHGWICVSIDPRGYTIKEPTADMEHMLSITAIPKGYIVISAIENWKPPYDKLIIQKVKEKSHKMLGLSSVPEGYIVTDITFNWKSGKHRYTIEKVEKKQHRMLSITAIPEGYVEISRIRKWRGDYDQIKIEKR